MCCISIHEGALNLIVKGIKTIRDPIHRIYAWSVQRTFNLHSPLGIILYTVMFCVSILEGA